MEFQEYPKWVKGVIVDDADSEAALLDESDDVAEIEHSEPVSTDYIPAKRGRKPKAK